MNEINPIYKELAAKMGVEGSESLPRIIEKLANLEQAKILRALPDPDRDPEAGRSLEVSEAFAKKLNLDKKTVGKHLQELYEKGAVFSTSKGPSMARRRMQLHDAATVNAKFDESLGDEYWELWKKFYYDEVFDDRIEGLAGGEQPFWRCIPKWRAIKDVPGILPSEDIREILKSQEAIALVNCCCKRIHNDRKCGTPEEMCLVVGRTALYNIDRGCGRRLTYEEAVDFVDQIDKKYPLVHLTINLKPVNQLICNCHWCCCESMLTLFNQDKYKVYEGIAKSRFQATVDPEKCRACKTCVNRCQFGAAQMKYYPEFGEERAYIDTEKCMGCGCCVTGCPNEARAMKLVRPPEHIPDAAPVVY